MSRKLALVSVVLLAALVLAGCPAPTPVVIEVEKVVTVEVPVIVEPPVEEKALVSFGVQQSWKNDAQSAPIHVAMKAGYYAEEGLDVHMVEGGSGVDGVMNTMFGRDGIMVGVVAGESELISKRGEGGIPVVIIGALMQAKPEATICRKDKLPEGDFTPEDLAGLKIGVGGAEPYKLQAMLGQVGMTLDDVERVRLDVSSVVAVATEIVDCLQGWVINQSYDLEELGIEWDALLYADYGIPMHGNVLYTTEERIARNPELLAAFVRATLRGVQRVIDDPEYAVQASLELGGGYDTPEKAAYIVNGLNSLALSPATDEHGIGWVDKGRVMEVAGFLGTYSGVPLPEDIDTFVDMRFVEAFHQ